MSESGMEPIDRLAGRLSDAMDVFLDGVQDAWSQALLIRGVPENIVAEAAQEVRDVIHPPKPPWVGG